MGLLSSLANRDASERPAVVLSPPYVMPMQSVSETAASPKPERDGRERGARHLPVFLVTESVTEHGASVME